MASAYRDRERDWDEASRPSARGGYSVKRYPISEDRSYLGSDYPVATRRPVDDRYDYEHYSDYDPVYPRDDSDHQLVHRADAVEDRWPSRRDDDDYIYRKRIREYDTRPRRDGYDYDYDGRSRRGRSGRGYNSDDDTVHAPRSSHEEDHPHYRRHLAEGAIAGVGAAELVRHHSQRRGHSPPSTFSRVGRDVGAGTVGVLAADAISRHRSKSRLRTKSEHRSESLDRGRDRRHRHRHHRRRRSRSSSSSSNDHYKHLAGLGLGAAAIAGAVALARKHSEKGKENNSKRSKSRGRRSRSRRRSGRDQSSDAGEDDSRSNNRVAKAGLAGATAAGLIDHVRSKSRSRKGRSRSRIRQGIPIAAAGIGSAAAAKFYEHHKGKGEKSEQRERRQSRSRSRSRARSSLYPEEPSNGLIEYGNHPVYSRSPDGHYDEEPRRSRRGSRSRSTRRRDRSSSSNGSRRHRRSRSRAKDVAAAGLGAAGAGLAGREYAHRKERKKAERENQRYDDEDDEDYNDPYGGGYGGSPPYPPAPAAPAGGAPYSQESFYPQANQYPPPPGGAPMPPEQRSYNASQYPPPPGAPPAQPAYPFAPQEAYTPQPFRGDENVSAAPQSAPSTEQHRMSTEGLRETQDTSENSFTRPSANPPGAGNHPDRFSSSIPQAPSPRLQRQRSSSPQPKSVQFHLPSSRSSRSSRDHESSHEDGYESDDSDSTIEDAKHTRPTYRPSAPSNQPAHPIPHARSSMNGHPPPQIFAPQPQSPSRSNWNAQFNPTGSNGSFSGYSQHEYQPRNLQSQLPYPPPQPAGTQQGYARNAPGTDRR